MVTALTIGAELRALRELRMLSQKDVAERVNISAPQVSQIETGKYVPSLEVLGRLLDVLDATLQIELNEGGIFHDPSGSEGPPARSAP